MDLELAIWQINPAAEYLLNKSTPPNQKILEWRGPGLEPTQQELDIAWQQWIDAQEAQAIDDWLAGAGIDVEAA